MNETFRVVAAGHICLDVIPGLDHHVNENLADLFRPGHLIVTGPALFSTGGSVSNTGLALSRLGIPTRLVAKVGEDPFGKIVCALVDQFDPRLGCDLVVDPQVSTSYTVIISLPDIDRVFLHCPGANDTFGAEDVRLDLVAQADLFHFGYPPAMRRMYEQDGAELTTVFRQVKTRNVTTSLDLSFPDPSSDSGRVNWKVILGSVLPFVDIFLPSFEEIFSMLHPEAFRRMTQSVPEGQILSMVTPDLLSSLAHELIEMGAKIVVIKMGSRGLYLRTAGQAALEQVGKAAPMKPAVWADQEIWAPCFRVNVVGTTGSGDATIAGFLSALLRGLNPRQAVRAAVAVGACNVEAADALQGIRTWEQTMKRIQLGWEHLPLSLDAPLWHWDQESGVWVGPAA